MSIPKISVVSPVYQAEDCIEMLVAKIRGALEPLGLSFEIILVDDGSHDLSWSKITKLCQSDESIRAFALSRNFGQHHAITAGLDQARGEWVIVMDCDLQDRPEEIPQLYKKAVSENFDMVLALRSNRRDSFVKKLWSKSFYFVLSYLSGQKLNSEIANFGIYHRKVVDAVNSMRESIRYFPVLAQWVGFKKAYLEVNHAARTSGASNYNFKRSLNLALNVILASSDKPLRILIKLGSFIAVVAIASGLFIFFKALFSELPYPGWASLIVSIWFFGGVIMATLGMVGLYVGRSFEEGKARPIYLIRDRVESAHV